MQEKKPFINKVNKKKRLEFAKLHWKHEFSFWEKVIFRDESKLTYLDQMEDLSCGENPMKHCYLKIQNQQLNMGEGR